jgi:hypothetical protein
VVYTTRARDPGVHHLNIRCDASTRAHAIQRSLWMVDASGGTSTHHPR